MHVKFIELYNTAYAEVVNNAEGILATKDMVIERFAELIVQECADISDASFHDGSAGFLAIKKHFGVK